MKHIMDNNLEKIFDFLKISGNLKNTYRYGDIEVLNNESTADHSRSEEHTSELQSH